MNVTLTPAASGQRADQFLAAALDGLTRSAAQKLLEEGRVLCDGRPLKKNDRLKAGLPLTILIPDPTPVALVPQDIPLDVVYEDQDVIVVNKPVGLVVHPAPGHPDGTLVNALLFHCGDSLSGINGELRPGIVHRIDRDTSGLLIAAKNDSAHLALAQQRVGLLYRVQRHLHIQSASFDNLFFLQEKNTGINRMDHLNYLLSHVKFYFQMQFSTLDRKSFVRGFCGWLKI